MEHATGTASTLGWSVLGTGVVDVVVEVEVGGDCVLVGVAFAERERHLLVAIPDDGFALIGACRSVIDERQTFAVVCG